MEMPLWKCFLGLAWGSQLEALLDAVWTRQSCIVCQACYCHLLVCWSHLHYDTILNPSIVYNDIDHSIFQSEMVT